MSRRKRSTKDSIRYILGNGYRWHSERFLLKVLKRKGEHAIMKALKDLEERCLLEMRETPDGRQYRRTV